MADESGFRKGISYEAANVSYIPAFLANLRIHPHWGPDYRQVDIKDYRNRAVRFLQAHGVSIHEPKSKDDLEFLLREQGQGKVDVANRTIILANKILVTTRETDKPSHTVTGDEIMPFMYLNAILRDLDPLSDSQIIDYGTKISYLFSQDACRNFIPDLVTGGLVPLDTWYEEQKQRIKSKNTLNAKPETEALADDYNIKLGRILDRSQQIVAQHPYALNQAGRIKFVGELLDDIRLIVAPHIQTDERKQTKEK